MYLRKWAFSAVFFWLYYVPNLCLAHFRFKPKAKIYSPPTFISPQYIQTFLFSEGTWKVVLLSNLNGNKSQNKCESIFFSKRSKEVSINSIGLYSLLRIIWLTQNLLLFFCKKIHELNNISSVSNWYIDICGCDRIKFFLRD